MAQIGMTPEDYASPDTATNGVWYRPDEQRWAFDLWPENWPALHLFSELSTQWRAGASGVFGLDYNVFFHEIDRQELSRDEYDDLMSSIRTIESAAISILNKKQP